MLARKKAKKKIEARPLVGIKQEVPIKLAVTVQEKPTEALPKPKVIVPKPKKPLIDQVLAFYQKAPAGQLSMTELMKETGALKEEMILQAWDRLYDRGLVPFGKLMKPRAGRVSLEG